MSSSCRTCYSLCCMLIPIITPTEWKRPRNKFWPQQMLCSWPPKLAVANYHLYVWGDQSSARRARPDELLDEDDEDVDDDSQGDWDDEEQDLPLHLPLVRGRLLKTWSRKVKEKRWRICLWLKEKLTRLDQPWWRRADWRALLTLCFEKSREQCCLSDWRDKYYLV